MIRKLASTRILFFVLLLFFFMDVPFGYALKKTHTVFFEGQENELHVYRINGSEPGKTLLIVGGIQGDEPGGFLAADLYADFSLKKGNLIVVPRANFPSILKQERQINQDMNRKFLDDNVSNYEAEVANVLKKLICESDCFLNLHEGSGIFSPTWQGPMRNPKRYGQSIIADAAEIEHKTGEIINLEKMALEVIEIINRYITDPDYRFHFNNHRTNQDDSLHKEQRGSATYYAFQTCKIPAFGIESAKSLPLEQKIRQHVYAINGFMEVLDIIPETPGVDLKKPELEFMIISVNHSIPVVVGDMHRLQINKGDTIRVLDIVTNYERGLSVDVIGIGNGFNDMKKDLVILEPTRIIAKKDFYACGSVFLDFDTQKKVSPVTQLSVVPSSPSGDMQLKFKINGKTVIADNYAHLHINRGDQIIIEDLVSCEKDPSKYVVNFKGFVGNASHNTGEDRGYLIDTSRDVLMPRFSVDKKGKLYYVLITLDGKEKGKVFLEFQL